MLGGPLLARSLFVFEQGHRRTESGVELTHFNPTLGRPRVKKVNVQRRGSSSTEIRLGRENLPYCSRRVVLYRI